MAFDPLESEGNAAPTSGWRSMAGAGVILLAAAVAVAPQLVRGNTCGHDFDIHLVSWFDCLRSWRHGIVYPQWTGSANYGAGEPRFIFYPPLTWMLGGALGALLPWRLVPIALTFLLLAATGMATRALARHLLPDGAATLAGCAAIFSGYALFTAYERAAFGEMAGFWIPLLLLLAIRERATEGAVWRRACDGSAALLALVVAGAWLSNAPLGVMASYLLAGVALVLAGLRRSWAPVLRAAMGAALGLGLAAFYLAPAAYEQRWVDIHQATDDPGLRIENSFLFGHATAPGMELHNFELTRVSWIAMGMIGVALLGLVVAWRRGTLPADRCWWIPLAVIPAGVLVLLLPFSLPVWNLLPKLRFLQFPWRWLVVVEAPMGVLFAAAVWPQGAGRSRSIPSEAEALIGPIGTIPGMDPRPAFSAASEAHVDEEGLVQTALEQLEAGNDSGPAFPRRLKPALTSSDLFVRAEARTIQDRGLPAEARTLQGIGLPAEARTLPDAGLSSADRTVEDRGSSLADRSLQERGASSEIRTSRARGPVSAFRGWGRRQVWVGAACTAFFLGSTAVAAFYFFQPCDDEDAVAPMVEVNRSGAGFEGVYEYEPIGADDGVVATGLPDACLVSDPQVALGVMDTPGANPDWWVEQNSCEATYSAEPAEARGNPEHLHVSAVTQHGGYLILRLRTYPAWRLTLNGSPASSLMRDDGLTVVAVQQGRVELDADWTETMDVRAGRWLTAAALLLVAGLGYLERRRRPGTIAHLS